MSTEYEREVVDPGDRLSAVAKAVNRATYGNHPGIVVVDRTRGFRGFTGFDLSEAILEQQLQRVITNMVQNDGAGGKPQFVTLLGEDVVFGKLGSEIPAMCADDIAVCGGNPLLMVNQVDIKNVNERNFHLAKAMMEGYGAIMNQSGLVSITGESAIMADSITAFCDTGEDEQVVLTWSGTCIGFAPREDIAYPVVPGMSVIGFLEPGYGCNGGGALTKLIKRYFGTDWASLREDDCFMNFLREITIPSPSFARTLARLNGWREDGTLGEPQVHLPVMAHITGGGIMKLKEALPEGIGVVLDRMPDPQPALFQAQQFSLETNKPFSDHEMHTTFNGGCRLYIICEPGDKDIVINAAAADGHTAVEVGVTIGSSTSAVTVHSKFDEGGVLTF